MWDRDRDQGRSTNMKRFIGSIALTAVMMALINGAPATAAAQEYPRAEDVVRAAGLTVLASEAGTVVAARN